MDSTGGRINRKESHVDCCRLLREVRGGAQPPTILVHFVLEGKTVARTISYLVRPSCTALDLRSTGRRVFKSYSGQKLRNNHGQVVHACAFVTKQYNLVPAKGR